MAISLWHTLEQFASLREAVGFLRAHGMRKAYFSDDHATCVIDEYSIIWSSNPIVPPKFQLSHRTNGPQRLLSNGNGYVFYHCGGPWQ
jgi:hypothetical protein